MIDVGCGTGEILNSVKNLYPAASIYGIDISEEMLKKAKEKLLNAAEISLGDAEHLPFENGMFDVLICTDSFHHYPNPQKAVKEFYRVLRNGGYLLLADFWKPFPVRQLMNIFIPFSNEGDVKIYSQNEIVDLLMHNGFQEHFSTLAGICPLTPPHRHFCPPAALKKHIFAPKVYRETKCFENAVTRHLNPCRSPDL